MKIPILQLFNAVKSGLQGAMSQKIGIFITSHLGLLMMSGHIVLRRTVGPKREEVTAISRGV
jgi:hypothetical protein